MIHTAENNVTILYALHLVIFRCFGKVETSQIYLEYLIACIIQRAPFRGWNSRDLE